LKYPEIKKKFLRLTTSDIFLNDIFLNFSVKSIELYNFTLTYLANNNDFLSLRELHKELDSTNNISIKTVIDYINFSLQTKILKRVYKYDIKTNKPITSKAKYYFTDN
jgi:predicted AAA+ superfamily ATPase